ncbi:MAG: FtsW/RodA/SpoVE family cell cycle protein [Oscillospiraceae bacterium]
MSKLLELIPNPDAAREALLRLFSEHSGIYSVYTMCARVVLALLAVIIVVRCIRSLMSGKPEMETWCYLDVPSQGLHLPISHWENVIGRSRNSDIRLDYPTVSRIHAALIRKADGWRITDLNSANGITVDGKAIEKETETAIRCGEEFEVGGIKAVLRPLSKDEELKSENRTKPGREIKPSFTLYLMTVFQIVMAAQLSLIMREEFTWAIPIGFALMSIVMWIYFATFRVFKRTGFEIDFIAFFLSSVGMAITASSEPSGIIKQLVAFIAGLIVFVVLCWCLRDLDFACSLRWLMAAGTVGLLLLTIVAGKTVYGALNWIYIGGMSIQPSELAKLTFVFAGSATLDRLFAKRNIALYLVLTAICAAALAYMNDFGAVIIFFAAFLVVAYLRSGSIATVSLITAAAGFGGLIVLKFKPYIAARFATWMHAWEFAHDGGFQQTRTMSAAASGGLFGVGAGGGWLKTIPAADTDLVFGMVSEEHGLIIAVCIVACICTLAIFSARSAATSRSSFYTIAACAATSMLVFQMSLNIFGSVDILPLTGVTLPFISNGGSSLISSFGLLAFVKAVDTRQNASFATQLQKSVLKRTGRQRR